MAQTELKLYKYLIENQPQQLTKSELARPDPTIEQEVTQIFTQARAHRHDLVRFYIGYTIVFTLFVLGLIGMQAYFRVAWRDGKFEMVPQWALNLLVTGMFAQFVGLLTVVTRHVWDFESFFTYHNRVKDDDTLKQPEAPATQPRKRTKRKQLA